MMKNFVLKDIEPSKVESAKSFLKEMNDFVLLISHVKGPHVAEKYAVTSGDVVSCELEENGYQVKYIGHIGNEKMRDGNFQLFENGTKIFEARYTINVTPPYDMFVMLNCGNSHLVKAELEIAFEREVSHESQQFINTDLPEQEAESTLSEEDIQVKEEEKETKSEKEDVTNKEVDTVTEEVEALSERVMQSIDEVQEIITNLNALCHDLTRGQSGDFSSTRLSEETLENGATVQLFDNENNGYKITFRKGMLDEQAEVAFFLEQDGELIFSVYLSSTGSGRISARKSVTIRQVKRHLFE